MSRAHWSRRGAILATGVAVVLGSVVSCSSGGSPSSSTQGSGGSGTAGSGSASKDLGTLKVITSSQQSLNFIGVEGDLNQWAGTGLSVKLISGDSGTVTSALASGTADIGLQAGDTAGLAIAKGLPAKIIGAMVLPWNQLLIASTKSGATKPEQLKGKKFGVTSFGSGGAYSTEKMAQKLGWSKNDYKLVKIGGGGSGVTAALKSGAIDAFFWSAGVAYNIESQGFGKIIGSAVDYVGPTAFEVMIASNDVIKKRPGAVKAFMQGYVNAIKQLDADPSKAVEILKGWGVAAKAAEQSVKLQVPSQMSKDGLIPAENLKGLSDSIKFLSQGSVTAKDPSTLYQSWKDVG